MFRPNQVGVLYSRTGRDKHARETFAPAEPLPLAVVSLEPSLQKTTVRADSSASRGTAEETAVFGIILVPVSAQVKQDDRVEIAGGVYRVIEVQPRYSVFGLLDHYEIKLGAAPQ